MLVGWRGESCEGTGERKRPGGIVDRAAGVGRSVRGQRRESKWQWGEHTNASVWQERWRDKRYDESK
jgi:hypothetical protein